MSKIIILLVFASVIWIFISTHRRTQQAWQWWFEKQSVKLAAEAEAIRENLQQESFAMRRTLESLADSENLSTQPSREWLKKLELFHNSLTELGDRLAPPYIDHSLPMAVEWLSQSWQKTYPQLNIKTELPTDWEDQQTRHGVAVMSILDELFRITLTAFETESILVSLKKDGDLCKLSFKISFLCLTTQISYSSLRELRYLRQTFRMLTSGQCFCHPEELTVKWCFQWRREKQGVK